MESKGSFIRELFKFYEECVGNDNHIINIKYDEDMEYLIAYVPGGRKIRPCYGSVTNIELMKDFIEFMIHFENYEFEKGVFNV